MAGRDPSIRKRTTDFDQPRFENAILSLHELMMSCIRKGGIDIRDRSFVNCRIEGPAVMLMGEGAFLDGCRLGDVGGGDVRSLLLRPVVGFYAAGVLPVVNCRFEACDFAAIGFTGSEYVLQDLMKIGR